MQQEFFDAGYVGDYTRLKKCFRFGFKLIIERMKKDKNKNIFSDTENVLIIPINDCSSLKFRGSFDDDDDYIEDTMEVEICIKHSEIHQCFDGVILVRKISEIMKDASKQTHIIERLLVPGIIKKLKEKLGDNLRKIPLCKGCGSLIQRDFEDENGEFCDNCYTSVVELEDEDDKVCAICQDKEKRISVWCRPKNCKHFFCYSCLTKHRKRDMYFTCPVCRIMSDSIVKL